MSASVLIGPFRIVRGTNEDDTTSIPCGAGAGIATVTGAGTGATVDGTGVADGTSVVDDTGTGAGTGACSR